jgi:glucose-6-phosphate 1-epimerase
MIIEQLNERHGIAGAALFAPGSGGLPKFALSREGSTAEIYLHGAHVTSYVPAAGKPVLWMSGKSWFEPGKPIRGGIPVCFPWFGRPADAGDVPAHGFVRLSEWHVESISKSDDAVEAVLSTSSGVATHEWWPFDFAASLTVTLAENLTVALEVKNTGSAPVTFTEALHSYFAVSDIRLASIEGLDGAEYIDTLLEREDTLVQRGDIRFTSEIDRPYLDTEATCTIDDPILGRRIEVRKSGSSTTVVWNPWIAKSRRMEDFGDDEWTGMVCVETANARKNAVTVDPGRKHRMAVTISVTG